MMTRMIMTLIGISKKYLYPEQKAFWFEPLPLWKFQFSLIPFFKNFGL